MEDRTRTHCMSGSYTRPSPRDPDRNRVQCPIGVACLSCLVSYLCPYQPPGVHKLQRREGQSILRTMSCNFAFIPFATIRTDSLMRPEGAARCVRWGCRFPTNLLADATIGVALFGFAAPTRRVPPTITGTRTWTACPGRSKGKPDGEGVRAWRPGPASVSEGLLWCPKRTPERRGVRPRHVS